MLQPSSRPDTWARVADHLLLRAAAPGFTQVAAGTLSFYRYWLAGKPVRVLARRSTNATVRNGSSFINLLRNTYPAFNAHLEAQGTDLPGYVEQEFEDYLEYGFLRVRCDSCHAVHLMAFSCY